MDSNSEGYLLLSLSNATLRTPTATCSGTLGLQCVTMKATQDVFLVLRIENQELPLEPYRAVEYEHLDSGSRRYTFRATEIDPVEVKLDLEYPGPAFLHVLEDMDTFDSILGQYCNLHGAPQKSTDSKAGTVAGEPGFPGGFNLLPSDQKVKVDDADQDLKGRLVLVNQDNGEVVGEFDREFKVKEDPALAVKGNENIPVVLEVPDDATPSSGRALEVFARLVPADQQDWMTKSATLVRYDNLYLNFSV
jgi:spartin